MNIQGDTELFNFLTNAPKEFRDGERIRKYQLKNGDYIHCVLWGNHFYITGTDVVKILVWRFQNSGRNLVSMKKFEEGVFSDLRNLKPGVDATLENPRSEFLEFLYKNGCIRTQKKQKVFYWYSVPHDSLFCDALERDLRRENSINNYGKFIAQDETQYYQEDGKFSLNRKLFKKQNPNFKTNTINYDPLPKQINPTFYSPSYSYNDNNIVKSLLFSTTPGQSPQTRNDPVSVPDDNAVPKFVSPFNFNDLDFQSSYLDNNNMFDIPNEFDVKKYKNSNTNDEEVVGNKTDDFSMPNNKEGPHK